MPVRLAAEYRRGLGRGSLITVYGHGSASISQHADIDQTAASEERKAILPNPRTGFLP